MRALLLLFACVLVGCSDANYDKAIASGLATIPCVSQFKTLFPNSHHFITYYTGDYGSPVWNSKVGIGSRYILGVQLDVTLDRAHGRITSSRAPRFYLNEVTSITSLPNGGQNARYGKSIQFGVTEWEQFAAAHADLAVFGIAVPIVPVAGFDKIVDNL